MYIERERERFIHIYIYIYTHTYIYRWSGEPRVRFARFFESESLFLERCFVSILYVLRFFESKGVCRVQTVRF